MKKIIIVGAGLGGLYTANRLINNGVAPEHILLIDPRAGNYTRPGHLATSIFKQVNRYTGIKTDAHSSAHHIKELERQMYNALKARHVTFVTERFVALQQETEHQDKAVITSKEDGSQSIYSTDFVFDCTGTHACVAQAVNDYQQQNGFEPVFHSKPLSPDNAIPHHLIAQVSLHDHTVLIDFLPANRYGQTEPWHYQRATAQKNITTREQLRALGWFYETFPTFHSFSQKNTHKICLYMETPPDLSVEQQSAWIKLLLNIYSNAALTDYTELEPSKKYAKKPRIIAFKNLPHQLNRATFQSEELPVIIIGFDALKGFDYRLADGVSSGIECCEYVLKHSTIIDGQIHHIALDAIEHALQNYIEDVHKVNLIELLHYRKQAIQNGYGYFGDVYAKAAEELPLSEHTQRRHHLSLAGEMAYQSSIFQSQAPELKHESPVKRIGALNSYLSSLIKSRQYTPASTTVTHHHINAALLSVINDLRREITRLSAEDIVNNARINKHKLCILLEQIIENFDYLDGTFSQKPLQKKSRELIEQLKKNTFDYSLLSCNRPLIKGI